MPQRARAEVTVYPAHGALSIAAATAATALIISARPERLVRKQKSTVIQPEPESLHLPLLDPAENRMWCCSDGVNFM